MQKKYECLLLRGCMAEGLLNTLVLCCSLLGYHMCCTPLCLQPRCFLLPVQVAQKVLSYYRQRAITSFSLVEFLLLEQHVDGLQSVSSLGYPSLGCLVCKCPTQYQFSCLTVTGLVCMVRKLFVCPPEMFLLFLNAASGLPQHHEIFSHPPVGSLQKLQLYLANIGQVQRCYLASVDHAGTMMEAMAGFYV